MSKDLGIDAIILTSEQEAAWLAYDEDEYNFYVEEGLYDPDTHSLFELPEWMIDGDPLTGPFDFNLRPSQGTIGW